jgi:tetratricopeptide (TPR) repeat protein
LGAKEEESERQRRRLSPVLERALKLYDGEDYYSASIELFKVVEGESGDSEANKQKAEFWMGKTLYKLKFYSASLSYFDKIVQKGRRPRALQRDAQVAGLALARGRRLGRRARQDRQVQPQPSWSSRRSRACATSSTSCSASTTTTRASSRRRSRSSTPCSPKSEFYVQAKLFEGATHVREYQAQPAAEALKEVLRASVESSDPKIKPYEDLANLSLARIFYSLGQYDLAVKYYDRVSMESYDWPNSLFEASWANFMLKHAGYSKALGSIHTLQAPFFENFIKPESLAEALTVKATIYFYNCLYDKAADVIAEFNENVPQLAQDLKRPPRPAHGERPVLRARRQGARGQRGPQPQRGARRQGRALRPVTRSSLRLRQGARPRARAAREGRPCLEVHRGGQRRPHRHHAAALAHRQRDG